MERSQIPVLQSLNIRPRPLSSHSIAWSPDGELAVAAEDCVHVFLPSYPSQRRAGDGGVTASVGVPRPQFSQTVRISSKIKLSKDLNRQLFAFAGSKVPSRDVPEGFGGAGPVTGRGAGMSQVLRAEWSPSALGCNLRPVLVALLTTGCLVAFGEHIDHAEAAESGLRSRSVKTWKILWGLGGMLPIPDSEEARGHRFMDERITSFSWAKEFAPGRALLAYATEAGDVVIIGVRFGSKPGAPQKNELQEGWDIQELARFNGSGPHTEPDDDAVDPDFVPSRTSFGLKWSQWAMNGQTRTAILAYVAPNYVGFRRVTIIANGDRLTQPKIEVEGSDTISTCLFLASDSFVEFEDAVWVDENGQKSARGYIATPSELKPFGVSLSGTAEPPLEIHSAAECSTLYPDQDGSRNPIVGIVIHPPEPEYKPTLPFYTAARLSATGTNQDWYETNLPEETTKIPQWADRIRKNTAALLSRATVMGGLDHESDSDEMDEESDGEDKPAAAMVHPYRFRIWGLAASPGGSSTAVVVSKYSSIYPHRQPRCNVYFGREPLARPADASRLTTEGKMWEWMHADGPPVPGVTVFDKIKTEGDADVSELKSLFRDVLSKQLCVFCDGTLTTVGDSAWCENGHTWAACVSTGLAIMEPGITRVCGVCGMSRLTRSELEALAREHLGPGVSVPEGSELCEACGGKFVV